MKFHERASSPSHLEWWLTSFVHFSFCSFLLPYWIAQLFAEEAWGRTTSIVGVIMFIISHTFALTCINCMILQTIPTFCPSDSLIYHTYVCYCPCAFRVCIFCEVLGWCCSVMYGSVILIHGFLMVSSCFTQTSKMHANVRW